MPVGAPTVSVVIPTYNRAALVGRAVDSVLAQTYDDFELLVVDDGSTDDTGSVLERITDPRVVTMPGDHAGVAAARNRALRVARGDWVAFLDDDNEWRPQYLERQLACSAVVPDAVVVYCPAESRAEGSDAPGAQIPDECPSGDVFGAFLDGWWSPVSGMLMRRSALREVGGFAEDLETHEDIDLMMNLARCGTFAHDPEVLVVRHAHRGQLSLDASRQARSVRALDRRWRRRIVASEGVSAYLHWIARWQRQAWDLELDQLYARPAHERRAAARPVIRRLVTQLPWSATALARATLLATVGPSGFESVRAGWRRARGR